MRGLVVVCQQRPNGRGGRGNEPLVPGRQYPWGSQNPVGCDFGNLASCGQGGPVSVQSYAGDVTENGIYDLGGNVHEHVRGWYSETYYGSAPMANPMGPPGPDSLERVPKRGGSFRSAPEASTLFFRGAGDDFYIRRTYAQPDVGFRCIRSIP